MKTCLTRIILPLLTVIYTSALYAAEITPFHTQNQSPLIQIFGLPSIAQGAVMGPGKGEMRLTLDLANNYTTDATPRERIVLDGESSRFTLHGRYGLGRRLEVGVEIPCLVIGGGFLDNFIENYHRTFGFPNGSREQAPQNRLLYRYEKGGRPLLNVFQSDAGLGDIKLTGGWQLNRGQTDTSRGITLRASLKLPTGDSASLRGSGSTDLALWLAGNRNIELSSGNLTFFWAAGAMAMTEGKVLQEQQRPLVGFGALGAGWSPVQWFVLKIQANGHTSFFRDSDFKQVDAHAVQLTLGGTVALSDRTSLDMGVTEDLIVSASPDVVFHLSLSRRF